jgi:hypothetical protein
VAHGHVAGIGRGLREGQLDADGGGEHEGEEDEGTHGGLWRPGLAKQAWPWCLAMRRCGARMIQRRLHAPISSGIKTAHPTRGLVDPGARDMLESGAKVPAKTITVADDRSYQGKHPYNLMLGTPFIYDLEPKQSGKWWTVTVSKAPYLMKPVTFHYNEQADAVLLISKIRKAINEMGQIDSRRLGAVKK